MSLQPPVSPLTQRRLDEHGASREAVEKVGRFIWLALRRRGVPYHERSDLVQEILLAALEAWPRYDAEIATPEKWLRGIICHHVQRKRARRAKDAVPEKAVQDLRDEATNAEELLMSEERRKLVHQLYQEVPLKYREAMLAHELEGLTLAEIALAHEIPLSTAHHHVQEGMRHLRAAFARWQAQQRQRGVLLLPLTLEALLEADRTIPDAPDEIVDLAWRLMRQKLLRSTLEANMDNQGQGNGPSPQDAADSPAPAEPCAEEKNPDPVAPAAANEPPAHLPPEASDRWPLGPVVVALLVGLFAGAWLDSVFRAPSVPIAREEPPILSAAPPVASAAISPAPSTMASAAPSEPPTKAAPPAGTASAHSADFAADQTAFDTARAAFVQGNMAAAIEALAQHVQRYPRSRNAPQRDRMWIEALISVGRVDEACQRVESYRSAHSKADDIDRLGKLCTMKR